MNQAIRRTWLAVAGVFILLVGSLTYVQFIHAGALEDNPWNSRQLYDQYGSARGSILVNGSEIAQSVPSDDSFGYNREYSQTDEYAALTGYFSMVYGSTGLESALGEELSGKSDSQFYDRIAQIFSNKETHGASVELTIDPKLQKKATELMSGHKGSIVAMNPKTGEIKAMVSAPSYDPNQLSSHDSKSVIQSYSELNQDQDKPLYNRAVSGDLYSPGSTFKIMDAVAALESGKYNKDSELDNPQNLPLPGTDTTLPNYVNGQCASRSKADIQWALEQSCNTPFAQIAMDLGEDKIAKTAKNFGYGQDLSVPLKVTPSNFPSGMSKSELALSSIGQYDVKSTPMQVAMMSSAIANDGVQMKPNMVKTVRSNSLSTLYDFSAEKLRESTSPDVAHQVRDWMVNDVDNGIASGAQVDGTKVAGKTGTAETGTDGNNQAWFTGFAPADDPELAVAIVYEDVDAVTGAQLTSPGAKQLFEAVLNQ